MLAALSHALDITEGQPRGHAERTCLISMRIATQLGLDDQTRSSLFHAALLKDAGCSSNAAKVAALYGADDADVKRDRKVTDHLMPGQSIRHLARSTAPGRPPIAKARHLLLVAHGSAGSRGLTELRCERGAEVARSGRAEPSRPRRRSVISTSTGMAAAIRARWWASRSRSAAGSCASPRTAEVYWQDGGGAAAPAAWRATGAARGLTRPGRRALRDRVRPRVLDLARRAARRLAGAGRPPATRRRRRAGPIAAAFAGIVDAKTPFTARHLEGVAEIAVALAGALGFDALAQRRLRRAGLLHDIGKLGVSNRILDKPGKLDAEEGAAVRRHPTRTLEILQRIPAFADLAEVAANHHEKPRRQRLWPRPDRR